MPKAEKLSRNNEIMKLYNAGLTLRQVGANYGISAERVRQILEALHHKGFRIRGKTL